MSDARETEYVWEHGPHANAWNGCDVRCREVPIETTRLVLGQVGTHANPEPTACLSCGKSAQACGKALSFCCPDCAGEPGVSGTAFTTHYPPEQSREDQP